MDGVSSALGARAGIVIITKWAEAEALANIRDVDVKKFV